MCHKADCVIWYPRPQRQETPWLASRGCLLRVARPYNLSCGAFQRPEQQEHSRVRGSMQRFPGPGAARTGGAGVLAVDAAADLNWNANEKLVELALEKFESRGIINFVFQGTHFVPNRL